MNPLHFRFRQRLGLLAAHALDASESAWVLKHVDACDSCRAELNDLKQLVAVLDTDAALDRPLPISSDAFRTRVLAQIRSEPRRSTRRPVWAFAPALTSIGLVGLGVLAGVLATRSVDAPPPGPPMAVESTSFTKEDRAVASANNAAFYERLEKTHARATAVRYLTEAQDILIQVTAAADCPDSPKDSVDVTREAQTSRSLLKRRAALVSGSEDTLIAARGVLEEVEGVLQQVAELPHCTRRTDVDAIARRMDRKNLLMKIDLMTQELAAP